MGADCYQVVMDLMLRPASLMNQMAVMLQLAGSGQKLLENVYRPK